MYSRDYFIAHIHKYIPLDERETEFLRSSVFIKSFKKGEYLLKEGQVSKEFFFNLKGCVRLFYVVNGEEKSSFFYTENNFISSYESFVHQTPAKHNFQCIEDCELVVITSESASQLLKYSPKFESLARIVMEEELVIYQNMVASYVTLNPEQRYQAFLAENGELMHRIPQHFIASYLGVNAESLSRIKKRLYEKDKKS
ncbi:Crp/Fnr family transcriptional regulator [Flexithrix dorotheae]|uniref:Crp/Fnr family transcriptional regulator n=1 Tax=Flexithrix dorotheae TaxID=70993 RepID=UPI00037589EA|nr:Crp/Fnr family transcriptional regulator [Flexithrix dorotheae]